MKVRYKLSAGAQLMSIPGSVTFVGQVSLRIKAMWIKVIINFLLVFSAYISGLVIMTIVLNFWVSKKKERHPSQRINHIGQDPLPIPLDFMNLPHSAFPA
jgi:hypothetical protein